MASRLQIGYFKVKQAFFRFSLEKTEEDSYFILARYLRNVSITRSGEGTQDIYSNNIRLALRARREHFVNLQKWRQTPTVPQSRLPLRPLNRNVIFTSNVFTF